MKGPHGAIEFVLALDSAGKVQHFELQAIREPPEVVQALDAIALEQTFRNKAAGDSIFLDLEVKRPSPAALHCAELIANEVHATLTLWAAAASESG